MTPENDQHPTQRPATPDDPPCSCGAPAVIVFLTPKFGPVSWCGVTR